MAQVLIVDNDADTRGYLGKFLRREGHAVLACDNGRDALRILLTDKPDAAVIDVRMPEMGGVELMEVLRSYLRWYGLPVIVLSAHLTADETAKLRALGVVYFFEKGRYEIADLRAAVHDATGAKGKDGGTRA
jgi:CheY-like chemotaxis protein